MEFYFIGTSSYRIFRLCRIYRIPRAIGYTGSASTVVGPTGFTGSQGGPGPTGFTGSASTVAGPTGFTGSASTVAGPTGFTGSASTVAGPTGFTGSASTVAGPVGFTGSASTVAGPIGFSIWCDRSIRCVHLGGGTFEIPAPKPRLEQLSDIPLLPADHVNFMKNLGIQPKVIYDIGACVLHWTDEAKKIWPDARFIAFEAMDAVESLYKSKGVEFCIGHPLYSQDGINMEFHENTHHPGGNSLYKENPELSPRAEELFAGKTVIRTTRTLDSLVQQLNIPLPDLIKMDIQGAELEALKGATETLKHCNHLILELQHMEYNIGAPRHDVVISYLEALGFKNHGMFCGSELGVDGDYYFSRK